MNMHSKFGDLIFNRDLGLMNFKLTGFFDTYNPTKFHSWDQTGSPEYIVSEKSGGGLNSIKNFTT